MSQQKPSTQKLLLHWNQTEHAWPMPSPQARPPLSEQESVASSHSVQTSDCSKSGQVLPLP